jgi:hypothetical protein
VSEAAGMTLEIMVKCKFLLYFISNDFFFKKYRENHERKYNKMLKVYFEW